MALKEKLSLKNGSAEIIKFGNGKNTLVILPGLSYDGFFDRAEELERAYAAFVKRYTVVLIDRNLTPKKGYSPKDMADDAAEVLKILNVKKADFFGVSLGGIVAQKIALLYPELVRKLVLGSTLSRPNETFLKALTSWERLAASGDINALVFDVNRRIYSPSTLKKYAPYFADVKTVATDEKTARFIAYINAAKNVDTYDSLDKICAKTLVIGAAKDKITTARGAEELAEKLHAEYFEYKKYGHAVFDEAKGYKKLVLRFLT